MFQPPPRLSGRPVSRGKSPKPGKSVKIEKGNLCPSSLLKSTSWHEYLGLNDVTPHDLRRTGACILEQLGFSDGVIGRAMTHKTTDKDAAPVTRDHYLVPVQIIARPVDPRVEALNALDAALREILGLTSPMELPARLAC